MPFWLAVALRLAPHAACRLDVARAACHHRASSRSYSLGPPTRDACPHAQAAGHALRGHFQVITAPSDIAPALTPILQDRIRPVASNMALRILAGPSVAIAAVDGLSMGAAAAAAQGQQRSAVNRSAGRSSAILQHSGAAC
jgi:hypothetical protein